MGILNFLFGKGKKEQKSDDLTTKNVAYLVVFSTPWCGPSKRFIKEIKEAGINNFAYINAEEEAELAMKFSVSSVPITFLLDRNGMIIKKWIGYDDNIPIGMVFVNTPLYNKKAINKAIWTIDFFISEHFEHKGIVYNAVLRVLNEMKNAMGAKVVYALVDQDNHDCIRLIGNGLFDKIDIEGFNNKDGGLPPFVYKIDVTHLNLIK